MLKFQEAYNATYGDTYGVDFAAREAELKATLEKIAASGSRIAAQADALAKRMP